MKNYIRVEICSPPDRDKLVAQIMVGNEQWAEVNQETSMLELEVYPRPQGEPWIIDLNDAITALTQARQRLVGGE